VLDDWFPLGRAKVDGIINAAGSDIFVSRPGSGLVYAFVFGVLAGHPLVALMLATGLSALCAVLLYLLVARFVRWELAALVAAVWVVLPNHTSMEYWLTCTALSLAVALVLGGGVLLAVPHPSRWAWAIAFLLFVAASLTYEAVLPVAAALAVFAPRGRGGHLHVRPLLPAGLTFAATAAYLVVNRNKVKTIDTEFGRLKQVFPGHFGWGIVRPGPGATLILAIAMLGIFVSLARLALPSFRSGTGVGERMVAAGMVVIVLGVVPFAAYLYAPLGAGDRFNLVSALGGAFVWVGLGVIAWRFRALALAGGAALVVLALVARADRTQVWTTAAADSDRVVAAITARHATDPGVPIVLGPSPVQESNVAALLDQSNVLGLLQYLYGHDVPGGIAYSRVDFEGFPEASRFDIWVLSHLHADVDLSSDHQGIPRTNG